MTDILRRGGLGRAYVGLLAPSHSCIPKQWAVFNGWGTAIAGPYLSLPEARVGLILLLEGTDR